MENAKYYQVMVFLPTSRRVMESRKSITTVKTAVRAATDLNDGLKSGRRKDNYIPVFIEAEGFPARQIKPVVVSKKKE